MGTARTLAGWLCVGAFAGCTTGSSTDLRSDDDAADLEAAQNTNLPPPPPNGTCALIERGTLGQVQDTDIGFGDGADYPMGNTPYSWTGVSPYDHWSAYKFDLGAIPANATVGARPLLQLRTVERAQRHNPRAPHRRPRTKAPPRGASSRPTARRPTGIRRWSAPPKARASGSARST